MQKVVIFGDSVSTYGGVRLIPGQPPNVDASYDLSQDWSITSVIQKLYPTYTIVNVSRGGMTTNEALGLVPSLGGNPFGSSLTITQYILDNAPIDKIVLRYGLADSILTNNATTTLNNLQTIIDFAVGQGIEVILIGVNHSAMFGSSANPGYYGSSYPPTLLNFNAATDTNNGIISKATAQGLKYANPRVISANPKSLPDGIHPYRNYGYFITSEILVQLRTQVPLIEQSPVPTASYSFSSPSVGTSVYEGESASFTVATTGIANGTVLWWAAASDTGSQPVDIFSPNPPLGSLTINSNTGTITVTVATDAIDPETDESFYIDLYVSQADRDSFINPVAFSNVVSITNGPAPPPPPVAQFSGTPVSGVAPLNVTFTDLSTNTPTSWAWDFTNDGITDSTSQNPSHTYSAAGTYTVKLSATNSGGSDNEVKASYITVTSPTANFTNPLSPTTVAEGNSITFSISTTGLANGSLLWWASFGVNGATPEDAVILTASSSVVVDNSATILFQVASDLFTPETGEGFYIRLYLTEEDRNLFGAGIAQSPTITIIDEPTQPLTLIRYNHFNQFRKLVNDAIGVNDNGFGTSSLLTRETSNNWRSAADHWSAMIKGLNVVYRHQTGQNVNWLGSDLINYSLSPNKVNNVSTGVKVSASLTNFLFSTASTYTIEPARYTVAPSQLGAINTENGISLRETPWTNTMSHVVKVSWLTTSTARYFFNLGGYISIDSTHLADSSAAEDLAWQALINGLTTSTYTRNDYVSLSSTKFYPLVNGAGIYANYQYDITATRAEDRRSITFNINYSTSGTATQVTGPSIIAIPNAATWVLGSFDPSTFTPDDPLPAAGTYSDQSVGNNAITLTLANNGALTITSTAGSAFINSSWGSPIVSGAGNNYWVRFTLQSTTGSNNRSTTPSTGWLALTIDRSAVASTTAIGQLANSDQQSTYLIEISTDQLGATIVSSGTFTLNSTSVANLFSPANPLPGSGSIYEEVDIGQVEVQLVFEPNGTFTARSITTVGAGALTTLLDNGEWGSPITVNAGENYWIRAVLNSEAQTGTGSTFATTTTGWFRLNSNFGVDISSVSATTNPCIKEANYTISIATDSLGNNIISTGTYGLKATAASSQSNTGGGGIIFGDWVQDPFTGVWYFVPGGSNAR